MSSGFSVLAATEWRKARLPQDLVAVRIADAGNESAVAEQRLELARVAANALAEDLEGQLRIVRIGTHLGPSRNVVQSIGCHEVELAQHLAVDVAQVLAAVEAEAEAGPCSNTLARRDEPEPPGQHRVRRQDPLLAVRALERDEEELPAPAGLTDGRSGQ